MAASFPAKTRGYVISTIPGMEPKTIAGARQIGSGNCEANFVRVSNLTHYIELTASRQTNTGGFRYPEMLVCADSCLADPGCKIFLVKCATFYSLCDYVLYL